MDRVTGLSLAWDQGKRGATIGGMGQHLRLVAFSDESVFGFCSFARNGTCTAYFGLGSKYLPGRLGYLAPYLILRNT
jgi:hypothetical protein